MYNHGYAEKSSSRYEGNQSSRDKRDDHDRRGRDTHEKRHRDRSRSRDRHRDRDRERDRRDDRHGREDRAYRDERSSREIRPPREERSYREKSPANEEEDRRDLELQQHKARTFKSVYKTDFTNRPTLFEIAPPGYEKTPVLEYKALKAAGSLPAMAVPQGSTIIPRARRLLLENLPENLVEDEFIECVNQELRQRNLVIKPGDAAISVEFGETKDSGFLMFRTSEETNGAEALDGMQYKGTTIKISRPSDYQPHNGYYFGCPHVFQDTLNKLFVACIPVHLTDDQVKELLTAFGELKAFNLVKDGASGLSKGYAFCEYRDGTVTDIAISGLNNMQIADKKLVVQRAVLGSRAGTNLGGIIPTQMQVPGVDPDHIIFHDLLVTQILCLVNMVSKKDLLDEREYKEIVEDVREECTKYGEIVSIKVPKPDPAVEEENFIGKIYVEFANKDNCKEAHENLAGRKFNERMVLTTFYDVDKYERDDI